MPALIIIWRLVSPIVIEAIDILRILSISDFRFSHSVREIPTLSNTMVIVFAVLTSFIKIGVTPIEFINPIEIKAS